MPKKQTPLNSKQNQVFENIAWSTRENSYALEEFIGSGINDRGERKRYMTLFVNLGLYRLENGKYTITAKGLNKFNRIQKASQNNDILVGFH